MMRRVGDSEILVLFSVAVCPRIIYAIKQIKGSNIMQRVLAHYVLSDLLERHFDGNKSQMAKQLDVTLRTLRRIINDEEPDQNSNTALSRALSYYVEHHIPLDEAFHAFVLDNDTSGAVPHALPDACVDRLKTQDEIEEADLTQYRQFLCFLHEISESVCPNCATGCRASQEKGGCMVLEIGKIVRHDMADLFYNDGGGNGE